MHIRATITRKMNQEAIDEITEWTMGQYIAVVNDKDENSKASIDLELPISSIDGVRLEIIMVRIFYHKISLLIILRNCEYENNISWFCPNRVQDLIVMEKGQFITCFTKQGIKEAIEKLFESITNYKYNNYEGHFTLAKIPTQPHKALFKLATLGKATQSRGVSECCICYEATKTHISKCNHVVCGRCITNMNGYLKCPICRAKIGNESDEDEEE